MATIQPLGQIRPDDAVPEAAPPPVRPRKRLVRRAARDFSQPLRRTFQALFVLLNLYLGVEFLLFVRQFEPGGVIQGFSRPPGVEGWLRIAGLMNFKYL